MTARLSVTVITLNEEHNIRRCLESVQGLADEVIVVDSGSKDRTGEIAEELGATFLFNEWPGHKEQKNFAIDQTRNDWILSLDADEWIDEKLAAEVRGILDQDDDGAHGYRIDRRTMFLGEFVRVWSPDWIFRLFKKDKGRFGGVNPHDVVVMQPGSVCRRLANPFFHNSYRTMDQYFARMNAYSGIAARALFLKGTLFSLRKLLLSPPWMLFKKLVIKRALFDGYRGLIIAVSAALGVFMKYAKLWAFETCGEVALRPKVSAEHQSRAG